MATTLSDPLLGHLVDGRYEVLSRIARGGMATVYLALDCRLDRQVALKVMHPHLAEGTSGAGFVARFRREAKAAARLTHPGLVAVLDQGVDGDNSYLVMEYVEGTHLRRRLEEEGPLPVGEALRTAEAVLEALAVAHRAGLVHRDVKPENVLISTEGRMKVADFGLARAVTEVTSTTTGTVLGTVAYLAPELVAHGVSDTRTDVYAVGILLYEMLTGTQPFTGATPIQVAYQHVHSRVPAPSDAVAWLPSEVDELVTALAAREPSDRPPDAGNALALVRRTIAALDDAVTQRRAPAPVVAIDDVEERDPDDTVLIDVAGRDVPEPMRTTIALRIGEGLDGDEPPTEPSRRRRAPLLAALVVTLLVLAGGAWWFMTTGPGAYTAVPAGLVGAERSAAEAVLAEAGLVATVSEDFHPSIEAGHVVSTTPGAGESVRKDGSVDLLVSLGPDMRTVPDGLLRAPVDEVTAALVAEGFTVLEPEHRHHDEVAEGHVIGLSVDEGSEHPVGTEVALTVSDGPEPVTITAVVGEARQRAVVMLEDRGLEVRVQEDFSEQYAAGIVMAQSPEAGTEGHRTDTVTITVSKGPPLVEVPNLVGKQLREAQGILEELGLVVKRENVLGGFFGTVRSQDVDPGETVPKGSTVTLTVV